jgi:UDP-N-acetylmuramate--alanine ligase
VVVVEIYRSREPLDPSVNAADIVKQMNHPDARHIPALQEAADYLAAHLKPGDVLLTLGAGDGEWVGLEVLKQLGGV